MIQRILNSTLFRAIVLAAVVVSAEWGLVHWEISTAARHRDEQFAARKAQMEEIRAISVQTEQTRAKQFEELKKLIRENRP